MTEREKLTDYKIKELEVQVIEIKSYFKELKELYIVSQEKISEKLQHITEIQIKNANDINNLGGKVGHTELEFTKHNDYHIEEAREKSRRAIGIGGLILTASALAGGAVSWIFNHFRKISP